MPQDFNSAEQQAIRKAREMYRRSVNYQNSDPHFHEQSNQPPEPQKSEKTEPPPPPPMYEHPNFQRKSNPLSALFDGDMKLIIAILLLLSGDGCDTMLLMALIYIML